MEGTTASAGASAPAAPSTTTESNPGTSGTQSTESSPVSERAEPAPDDHRAKMIETVRRTRGQNDATGKASSTAARDASGRFAAQQPGSTEATRPDPEAGEPAKAAGEGEPKGEPKAIPEPAFKERLARERKQREALQAQHDEATLRLRKAEAAAHLVLEENKRLREMLQAGQAIDPRDLRVRDYELANAARERAAKIEAEAAQGAQARAQEAADLEAAEAVRGQINTLIGQFPGAAFDEVVMHANAALQRGEQVDLGALVKTLHEKRMAGWQRVPPAPSTPPVAPSSSRAQSAGPSAPMFADHDRDAMKATLARWRASQRGA